MVGTFLFLAAKATNSSGNAERVKGEYVAFFSVFCYALSFTLNTGLCLRLTKDYERARVDGTIIINVSI